MAGALAAATALTGTGLGVAAASGVLTTVGGAGEVTVVDCYDGVGREANITEAERTADDPIKTCHDLWRAGKVGDAPSTPTPPPLIGCITTTDGRPGQVKVVPGRPGTCERLGWEPARTPTKKELAYAASIRAVDRALDQAAGDRCLTREALTVEARRLLREHHLSGWDVQQQVTGNERCALHSIDQLERTIRIAK
jgi:hypothetical protein